MAGARRATPALVGYITLLASGAAGVSWVMVRDHAMQPGDPTLATLPVLAALLITAEYLFVRFRFRGEVNGLNLFEAALAPVLFAFEPALAVATVAVAQTVGGVLRRNAPVKAAFNVAQWSLAAAAGAAVISSVAAGAGIGARSVGAVLLGLAVVGIINQSAFTIVIAIAERRSVREVIVGLGPIMLVGWGIGWAVNSAVGLLFVFAYAGHPASVVLFAVPLIVLHLAYRGYAGARSDRVRLSGLHSAARKLAEPLDPSGAIVPFLREVAESFEARAAALALAFDGEIVVHTVDLRDGGNVHSVRHVDVDEAALEASALRSSEPLRIIARGPGELSEQLHAAGWRECLTAPLIDEDVPTGALLVFDQAGLEGFEAGELAVLQAVARETVSTLAKGRLLERILEERRRLAEIVGSTSDGIATIGADGRVESWNRAMEQITGLTAAEMIGALDRIDQGGFTSPDGEPVRLHRWMHGEPLPTEIRVTDARGRSHRLSCSYSHTIGDDRVGRLVIIARDVSSEDEIQELRYEFGRLSRSVDAQRRIVERLQEAVMPAPLSVPGFELGVCYLASDPLAPTGGDLYDWVLLPTGEIQIAVVDVLGHGVPATKDAVSVVHALRVLAAQGCPIDTIVARADEVLNAHEHELVATVVVVRIDPATGLAQIAAGGHPPALIASGSGGVQQVAAPGGPIGWPGAGSVSTVEVQLPPGGSLVLYTDGLIEAGKDIIAGEEALIRHTRALIDASASEMARGLVDRALSDGARRDDSVAVVVRRSPLAERRAWTLEPDAALIARARHQMTAWFEDRGIAPADHADAALIATELLSNAVRAAESRVELRVSLTGGTLTIEVEDDGAGEPGLDLMGVELPDRFALGGRGLFVVRALSDDVAVLSTADGTIVTSSRRLTAPVSPVRGTAETSAQTRGR
jgi:PAS domain S-box-containing protein